MKENEGREGVIGIEGSEIKWESEGIKGNEGSKCESEGVIGNEGVRA